MFTIQSNNSHLTITLISQHHLLLPREATSPPFMSIRVRIYGHRRITGLGTPLNLPVKGTVLSLPVVTISPHAASAPAAPTPVQRRHCLRRRPRLARGAERRRRPKVHAASSSARCTRRASSRPSDAPPPLRRALPCINLLLTWMAKVTQYAFIQFNHFLEKLYTSISTRLYQILPYFF